MRVATALLVLSLLCTNAQASTFDVSSFIEGALNGEYTATSQESPLLHRVASYAATAPGGPYSLSFEEKARAFPRTYVISFEDALRPFDNLNEETGDNGSASIWLLGHNAKVIKASHKALTVEVGGEILVLEDNAAYNDQLLPGDEWVFEVASAEDYSSLSGVSLTSTANESLLEGVEISRVELFVGGAPARELETLQEYDVELFATVKNNSNTEVRLGSHSSVGFSIAPGTSREFVAESVLGAGRASWKLGLDRVGPGEEVRVKLFPLPEDSETATFSYPYMHTLTVSLRDELNHTRAVELSEVFRVTGQLDPALLRNALRGNKRVLIVEFDDVRAEGLPVERGEFFTRLNSRTPAVPSSGERSYSLYYVEEFFEGRARLQGVGLDLTVDVLGPFEVDDLPEFANSGVIPVEELKEYLSRKLGELGVDAGGYDAVEFLYYPAYPFRSFAVPHAEEGISYELDGRTVTVSNYANISGDYEIRELMGGVLHELGHLFNAPDTYGEGSYCYEYGLPEPQREPLYPQERACLMCLGLMTSAESLTHSYDLEESLEVCELESLFFGWSSYSRQGDCIESSPCRLDCAGRRVFEGQSISIIDNRAQSRLRLENIESGEAVFELPGFGNGEVFRVQRGREGDTIYIGMLSEGLKIEEVGDDFARVSKGGCAPKGMHCCCDYFAGASGGCHEGRPGNGCGGKAIYSTESCASNRDCLQICGVIREQLPECARSSDCEGSLVCIAGDCVRAEQTTRGPVIPNPETRSQLSFPADNENRASENPLTRALEEVSRLIRLLLSGLKPW